MSKRRNGRILAFQAMYSWEVGGVNIDDLLSFSWLEDKGIDSESDKTEQERLFAKLLVNGTVENISQIDGIIKSKLSEKWTIDRINKVALTVLRLSIYEMIFQKETDSVIIIDEAIEISKDFGAEDSYKFINAVLDNVRKDLEKTNE